jgi:hypothetical protein
VQSRHLRRSGDSISEMLVPHAGAYGKSWWGRVHYLTWCGAERGAAFFREEDCGVCFVARLRCAGEESKLWS